MKNERGNAVLIILIGIVLFAALSYAVTQSTRGGNMAVQQAEDAVLQKVMDHFLSVKIATMKLISSGQCDEYSIRFWHADRINAGSSDHYGDGSNTPCQVFHPDGGGVAYMERPSVLGTSEPDEIMVLNERIAKVGSDDQDGGGQDLIMAVNIPREICIKINEMQGITNPSGEPPVMNNPQPYNRFISPASQFQTFPSAAYDGYTHEATYIGNLSSRAPEVKGHQTGCFAAYSDAGTTLYYSFYTVILVR